MDRIVDQQDSVLGSRTLWLVVLYHMQLGYKNEEYMYLQIIENTSVTFTD